MALKATIFKADLQVSDLDRHYYAHHALTVARHPSETDERMMVRLLAFALHADPALVFTRGLSTDDEPDLWRHADDGTLVSWIEVGLPDPKRLRRACGLAEAVTVVAYGGAAAERWWARHAGTLDGLGNLAVRRVPPSASRGLEALVRRSMRLDVTVDGGVAWVGDAETRVEVAVETLR
ncbi:MAG: YaeQ family protein [Gammaproteobacteria bacterium]|nr:YaeQ family protein [Gammaproteobacteria bacterium]